MPKFILLTARGDNIKIRVNLDNILTYWPNAFGRTNLTDINGEVTVVLEPVDVIDRMVGLQ